MRMATKCPEHPNTTPRKSQFLLCVPRASSEPKIAAASSVAQMRRAEEGRKQTAKAMRKWWGVEG